MNKNLTIFFYSIDVLISYETNLLKYELDFLLMQYLFNLINLLKLNDIYIR